MKNLLQITSAGEDLLGTVDDGTNRLFINDTEIAASAWTGTGSYAATVSGHQITITKIADTSGNVAIRKTGSYAYQLYDQKAVEYLPLTGGTLTGDLYIPNGYAIGSDSNYSKLITESNFNGSAFGAPFCIPHLSASQIGGTDSWTSQNLWYWLKYVTETYGSKVGYRPITGLYSMGSLAIITGFIYNGTDLVGNMPRYSTFFVIGYGGNYLYDFGTQNGTFFSRRSAQMSNWT